MTHQIIFNTTACNTCTNLLSYEPKKCSAGKILRWVTTLCATQSGTSLDATMEKIPECEPVELESAMDIFNEQITHDDKAADPTVMNDDFDFSIVDDFDDTESNLIESTGLQA